MPSLRASARTAGVILPPAARGAAARDVSAGAVASMVPTTVPASACASADSNSTSGSPTATRPPVAPCSLTTRADRGDGISTTALSVSTATSG